jgi:hypothetical protein
VATIEFSKAKQSDVADDLSHCVLKALGGASKQGDCAMMGNMA